MQSRDCGSKALAKEINEDNVTIILKIVAIKDFIGSSLF